MIALGAWLLDWPGSSMMLWLSTALAVCILALDGVDGWLARRFDECSDWGARFDMEVDAAFIMMLCLLLWWHQLAPVWVMLIGLMRYGFVAGALFFDWLAHPLPDRFRRKLVCVLQLAALIFALSPLGLSADGWREGALAFALFCLVLSFAADIRWLHARRERSTSLSPDSRRPA